MPETTTEKYVLVREDVLPEIFKKVLMAKTYLLKDKAKNLSQACIMADLSRSAFYKYKDSVAYYENDANKHVVTIYLKLNDEPGVLSNVLSTLYRFNLNILTVNQNIPADMVAVVTITVRMDKCPVDVQEIINKLSEVEGVISSKKI